MSVRTLSDFKAQNGFSYMHLTTRETGKSKHIALTKHDISLSNKREWLTLTFLFHELIYSLF